MEMMYMPWMGKPLWMWVVFMLVVVTLMALDLGVLHRKSRVVKARESIISTLGYMFLAVLFGGWIGMELGTAKAVEFYTGYVVEFSLSMDNVFVIALILGFFHIPAKYQHRVLFWGILGVLILRGVMIFAGAALVSEFHEILYFFAAFLVFSGIKMLLAADSESDLNQNPVLKFLRRYGRMTDKLHGDKFFVRLSDENTGHYAYYMTPLFAALLMVEFADVVFAVDSVPAIFAITTDPYIVFTSNIFAILGLRSLYFALAAMIDRFSYLKYALALVLIFIGSKIFITDMLDIVKFPPAISLGVTFLILAGGVGYSLWKTSKEGKK